MSGRAFLVWIALCATVGVGLTITLVEAQGRRDQALRDRAHAEGVTTWTVRERQALEQARVRIAEMEGTVMALTYRLGQATQSAAAATQSAAAAHTQLAATQDIRAFRRALAQCVDLSVTEP